ncbi:hypothetical protein [Actinoplanes palleronii]|uniref:Uncharacterized protein n=1 Tax=Actinoplanes palleronii TaxID=113570 RepID=A0ABQ4B5Z3_9ACTN|nr:hypothetical protein [Actinoplanes palleronii]GIE66060.1 hypothetical protein Apa02nite_021680 [Actinoplanes palleronii]
MLSSSYRVAWAARRPLTGVLLLVVAGHLLVSTLLDLFADGDVLVILDGNPQVSGAGAASWARPAVTVVFWLIGLVAAAWVVARDGSASPAEAIWHGMRRLPVFALGAVATAGAAGLALWTVAEVSTGPVFVLVALAVLVAAAFLTARVLLIGIGWAVGEPRRVPGRAETGTFLLAAVLLPMLLGWLRGQAGPVPYADRPLDALLLAAVIAVQAGAATRRHVEPAAPERPARVWPFATAAVLTAALTVGAVTQNPYQAPVIRTGPGTDSTVAAVGWPAGQHPVIVTLAGVRYCDDDRCTKYHGVTGGPAAVDSWTTTTIGADGTVVKTSTSGGEGAGGPFLDYARCGPDGCRTAYLPVRTSATDKLDMSLNLEVAGASAPDGALWFFVAAPVSGGAYGRYRLTLIRCAEVACASPERHELGVTDRTPSDDYPDGRRARLTIGAEGRPAAAFWLGHSILRYTCDRSRCGQDFQPAGEAVTTWTSSGDRAAALSGDLVFDGDRTWQLGDFGTGESGAVVLARRATYVAAAVAATPAAGFRITVGSAEPQRYRRETVWRCAGSACTSVPLDTYAGEGRKEMLAVSEDGRVLVVRDDRVLLLETPL